MRRTLTDRGVAGLRARPQRYAFPDPELAGLYVRVQPSGAKSFAAVARSPSGKQLWATIGAADAMPIAEARKRARVALGRIRDGLAAFEPQAESFAAVAEQWLARHAEAKKLRTIPQIKRLLKVHVLPKWGERALVSIRRSDVAALLDRVEDNHGARQADVVLTIVRSIMNWHAIRNDDYAVPIVRGMRRQDQKQHARARILDDDEIRAIWKAAESSGTFGAFLRICLLTAQRRTTVARMKWTDIVDGEWIIPQAHREKGNAGTLVLPAAALAIINAQPRLATNPFVFAARGNGPLAGFGILKATFDAKLPADMPRWTIHDLRRTSRSLMSRAGVLSEHAERVMGHAIAGIEAVYDRHRYDDEKAAALAKLAALIATIIDPRPNVVALARREKGRSGNRS